MRLTRSPKQALLPGMAILVTGGAGYIGSAFVERLREAGESVVVVDDLSTGHRDALAADVPLYVGGIGDRVLVEKLVDDHEVDICVHFAGLIVVSESVLDPLRYYAANVAEGIALLETLTRAGVRRMVFSSSAAVYGAPKSTPISESHECMPESPYGRTKMLFEQCLGDVASAVGGAHVALRYFNAAGATRGARERHEPETHLIPNALKTAMGIQSVLKLFGTDFPTRDGTAERDYVHVADLAEAHLQAVHYLRTGGASCVLNLGGGTGTTVREVVSVVERVTGRRVPIIEEARRAGDPARLVADISKAREVLGWRPTRSDLACIVESAWRGLHA